MTSNKWQPSWLSESLNIIAEKGDWALACSNYSPIHGKEHYALIHANCLSKSSPYCSWEPYDPDKDYKSDVGNDGILRPDGGCANNDEYLNSIGVPHGLHEDCESKAPEELLELFRVLRKMNPKGV